MHFWPGLATPSLGLGYVISARPLPLLQDAQWSNEAYRSRATKFDVSSEGRFGRNVGLHLFSTLPLAVLAQFTSRSASSTASMLAYYEQMADFAYLLSKHLPL